MADFTAAINTLPGVCFARLQQLIDTHLGDTFPALSLAVIYRGDIVLDAGWGWIDPGENQYPVIPDSRFDLASVTKLFVETAFLSLVSAGKVSLDTPVVSILPRFGEGGPRSTDGGVDPHTKQPLPTAPHAQGKMIDPEKVLFSHLLTHTSGLAAWRDVYQAVGPPPPSPGNPDDISRQERWSRALSALYQYPFVDEPGQAVIYSDLGLMLLGEAVSRLHSEQSGVLDKAVYDRVLQPLSLTSVVYNPFEHGIDRQYIPPTEYDMTWRERRCWGEVHDENACGVGGVAGHAGLFATSTDVAAFGQAWLSYDERLGIVPELMNEATTYKIGGADTFRLGYGWMLRALSDSSAGDMFSINSYGHTGFTGTSLWVDPEKHLVITCLTNRVYPGRQKPGIHAFRRACHDIIAEGLSN